MPDAGLAYGVDISSIRGTSEMFDAAEGDIVGHTISAAAVWHPLREVVDSLLFDADAACEMCWWGSTGLRVWVDLALGCPWIEPFAPRL